MPAISVLPHYSEFNLLSETKNYLRLIIPCFLFIYLFIYLFVCLFVYIFINHFGKDDIFTCSGITNDGPC